MVKVHGTWRPQGQFEKEQRDHEPQGHDGDSRSQDHDFFEATFHPFRWGRAVSAAPDEIHEERNPSNQKE